MTVKWVDFNDCFHLSDETELADPTIVETSVWQHIWADFIRLRTSVNWQCCHLVAWDLNL